MAKGNTTLLPWWVFVILAVFAFIVLHALTGLDPDPGGPSVGARVGAAVGRSALIAVATLIQYVLPVLLVIAAAVSAFKSSGRRLGPPRHRRSRRQ
jgi:heme/copper-type cytochrome/quinol oxidase subunit 2